MIKIYLKIAWRNIIREKWVSLINITGLSVSIAAFILLITFIRHEVGFDKFHPEGEKVYRVISSFGNESASVLPRTLPHMAELITDQIPVVAYSARLRPEGYGVKIDGEIFERENFLLTDPSFTEIFNFEVIAGDLTQTLADPSAIAITKTLADKLIGKPDPIGQVIEVEQAYYNQEERRLNSRFIPVRIGALLADPPTNTHLKFSVLQSFESYDKDYAATFSNDVFVYFKTIMPLEQTGQEEILSLIKEDAVEKYGENYRDLLSYRLQPMHDIHFGQKYGYDMGVRGNLDLIYVFSAVALFILSIAVINFVNLVTARSEKRAIEAAIRKVSGANRAHIITQFIGEAVLICFIAFFIGLALAELLTTPFSSLLNRDLHLLKEFELKQILVFLIFAPVIGIIAGAYPAFVFSKYQPVQILRGHSRGGSKSPLLRIILVIVQFSISVILIISVLVFNRQTQYMKNADLGFSPENVLVISGLSERIVNSFDAIKHELHTHPAITNVSSSHAFPGSSGSGMSLRKADDPESATISSNEYRIGKDFQATYGIKLKEGRWFDFDLQSDMENFIINETAARALGLNQPIDEEIIMWRRKGRIIGITEDFHISSLKSQIEPLVITAYSSTFYHIGIKMDRGKETEALEHIRNTLAAFDPNFVFNEWHLDNHFRNLYKQEENNNTILNSASILAIIIAMLGVLGLSSYIISARTNEIGIRKVLGATDIQVIRVLFTDIIRWVVVANIIAWPVAWYLMSQWLAGFPYRISFSLWYLVIASLVSVLIVLFTVSGQTIRAASKNPVDALKTN
jgi:putative ABC transport system permease protein